LDKLIPDLTQYLLEKHY
jgi:hypothetical protein